MGTSKDDYAGIIRWMSFSNSELFPALCGWFRPLIGKDPYNADSVAEAKKQTLQRLSILESHLASSAFLVNATPTLADLLMASQIARGFQFVLDKDWRAEAGPNVTRWYESVVEQDMCKAAAPNPVFIEKALEHPPK